MRPPRVRTRSVPSSIHRIYTSGPCSCWASSCMADLPALECLMRFLFVGPTVCLGLPSDPTSRRTPLSLAMRLALPPALGTFTLKNVPLPSTLKKSRRLFEIRRSNQFHSTEQLVLSKNNVVKEVDQDCSSCNTDDDFQNLLEFIVVHFQLSSQTFSWSKRP